MDPYSKVIGCKIGFAVLEGVPFRMDLIMRDNGMPTKGTAKAKRPV